MRIIAHTIHSRTCMVGPVRPAGRRPPGEGPVHNEKQCFILSPHSEKKESPSSLTQGRKISILIWNIGLWCLQRSHQLFYNSQRRCNRTRLSWRKWSWIHTMMPSKHEAEKEERLKICFEVLPSACYLWVYRGHSVWGDTTQSMVVQLMQIVECAQWCQRC